MQYWSVSQPTWCAVCSRSSTRQHDSSIPPATTRPHHRCVGRHCTGCVYQNSCSTVQNLGANTFKVLHDSAPRYLGPLVAVADLPGRRTLRSASTSRLVAPPIKLSTAGSRAFPVTAAQVWNGLPEAVISSSKLQTFRRQLKTHLFRLLHLTWFFDPLTGIVTVVFVVMFVTYVTLKSVFTYLLTLVVVVVVVVSLFSCSQTFGCSDGVQGNHCSLLIRVF